MSPLASDRLKSGFERLQQSLPYAIAQRFVEGWAGPAARFKDLKIKLGAPNYPGDTMTFSGEVVRADAASREVDVALKGKNSMGSHVTGTATLVLP